MEYTLYNEVPAQKFLCCAASETDCTPLQVTLSM